MASQQDTARHQITQAIKKCKKGRPNVAAELSALVGQTVTEYDLNEFTRDHRSDRGTKRFFPMDWVSALAKVTGSHELEQYALCDDCRRAFAIGKVGAAAMAPKLR
jgi:hypothetical protein